MTFLIARRDELTRVNVTFGHEPEERWLLEPKPDPTADQQHQRLGWVTETH